MFCDPNRDICCMPKPLDVIDHVWLIVPSAFETLSLILICVPLDSEADETFKWVFYRAASVHTHEIYTFLSFVTSTWTSTERVLLASSLSISWECHCWRTWVIQLQMTKLNCLAMVIWAYDTGFGVIAANIAFLFLPLSFYSWLLLSLLLLLLLLRSPTPKVCDIKKIMRCRNTISWNIKGKCNAALYTSRATF